MKYFLYIVVFFVVGSVQANAQSVSQPVRVVGRIESLDSTQLLPYVHIIIKNTGKGIISDSLGIFKITMFKTDTLTFRCIGFVDQLYVIPDSLNVAVYFIKIFLSPTSYELNVVEVFALTSINQFKYDFKHFPLDESYLNKQLIIPGVNKLDFRTVRTTERSIYPSYIGGPLAFVYKLTDKSKSLKKLSELVADDELLDENKDKYNYELLGEFTGFTGDKLLSFYAYLNFSVSYIHNTNAYDILIRIQHNIDAFEDYYLKNGAIISLPDSIQN